MQYGWLYEAAVQKIPDLSAYLLLLFRLQPACRLPDGNCPRIQRYLMTNGSCQAYVMIPATEHVIVLAQQLRHSLAFLVVCAAMTGHLVQLLHVWWDSSLPSLWALSGLLRRIS